MAIEAVTSTIMTRYGLHRLESEEEPWQTPCACNAIEQQQGDLYRVIMEVGPAGGRMMEEEAARIDTDE